MPVESAQPAAVSLATLGTSSAQGAVERWLQHTMGVSGAQDVSSFKNITPSQLIALVSGLRNEARVNPSSEERINELIDEIEAVGKEMLAKDALAVSEFDRAANKLESSVKIAGLLTDQSANLFFSSFIEKFKEQSELMSQISTLMLNSVDKSGGGYLENMARLLDGLNQLKQKFPDVYNEFKLGSFHSDLLGDETRGLSEFNSKYSGKPEAEILQASHALKTELSGYLAKYLQTYGGADASAPKVKALSENGNNSGLLEKITSGTWLPSDLPTPSSMTISNIDSTIIQLEYLKTVNEGKTDKALNQFIDERIQLLSKHRNELSMGSAFATNNSQQQLLMSREMVFQNRAYLDIIKIKIDGQIANLENSSPVDETKIKANEQQLQELRKFQTQIDVQMQAAEQIIKELDEAITTLSKGLAEAIEMAGAAGR